VVLLLLCGFRISEALGIRTVDITPRERGRKAEVRIRRKGRDHRTIFGIDDEWLAHRLTALKATTADDRPVFDLDRFRAGRPLARIGRQAGIDPPPNPHILRHTFCAHLLQAGLDAREVQRLAGHRDLRTTQRYVDALKRSNRPVSSLLGTVFSEMRDELDAAA
jgi:integrase/recombinase XerD